MAQIRTAVDARLTALWSTVTAAQDMYAAGHNGRYWQGLRSASTIPSEGNESLPDIGTRCPTDQIGVPWPAAIRNAVQPMAVASDVYDSPLGTGYVITVWVRVLGTLYARSQNVGPEQFRTQAWHVVDEVPT